jgi:hypothetical protein
MGKQRREDARRQDEREEYSADPEIGVEFGREPNRT